MLKQLFILVLTSFILSIYSYAQTPSYYHYTSDDGLASSTVYNIIQDRDGFIWFATINGMSKFDGKHFTTYNTRDGLNSNSIISLAEGKNGELYIGNYEKGINVLRNGRIENYCSEIRGKSFALSYLLLSPRVLGGKEEQKLYAYRSSGVINSIRENKSGELITKPVSSYPVYVNRLERIQNGEIIALTTTGLYNFKDDKLARIALTGLSNANIYCLTKGDGGSYYIGTKGMICKIKDSIVVSSYNIKLFKDNNDVNAIYRDKNNNLWFSVMNRGFFYIKDGSDQITDVGKKMGLQNTLVNNYLEDKEGNIWISTYGNGVYCLNNLYLKSYNENDGMNSNNVYSIVKERSGKLVIGTFNGINIFENGSFKQIKGNSNKTLTEYIYRIKTYKNEFYVCGAFGGDDIKNRTYKDMNFHMISHPSFCSINNELYLFGSPVNSISVQTGFESKRNKAELFYLFGNSPTINRINDIVEDTEKNVWIGTGMGLCKVSNLITEMSGWKKTFFPLSPVLNSKINSIYQDNNDCMWFAGEKGFASYNLKNDSVTNYTNIQGHDLSSTTSIVSDNKKRIWIGNMKGLYLMDGKSIRHLNRQTGLPSDEVFSLCFDKEKNLMYIGTSNGISFLDISLFDNYSPKPPDVKLTSLKAGDSIYTSYSNLVLEPEQNHVSLEFKVLSFSSQSSIRYKYILNGESAETDQDQLDLVSLKFGTYNLQIMAKSQNTDWSQPCFLSFRVLPRFVETIWFTLLIILTLGVFSVTAMIWWLRLTKSKVRKELELSERINDLKHQALSAMMNPHFIANSLNSVQYLVNSRKYEEANDYIAMMAKLMRKNLDTAGNGFILLAEEMNRLKLYLDLEKLRFQEGFSYEIITGTGVDKDSILIPNMIIQPFVENTLWHGIINSGSKGLVSVSFTFEDVYIDTIICKSLIIKITDNGIGVNAAKKNKQEDHISKGIQIIEERLQLLSAKMQLPQPIMLEDLSTRNNNSHGTEVIISLPPALYKVLPFPKLYSNI